MVFRVFRVVVFEDRREATGDLPQKLPQGFLGSTSGSYTIFTRLSDFSDFLELNGNYHGT